MHGPERSDQKKLTKFRWNKGVEKEDTTPMMHEAEDRERAKTVAKTKKKLEIIKK